VLLNVVCSQPFEAVQLLEDSPGIRDVALHGTEVHVLTDPDVLSAETVAGTLTEAGIAVQEIRQIEPSLEDVFISLIGSSPTLERAGA
jgi:ABC-2 type transport system ATP-binding protein